MVRNAKTLRDRHFRRTDVEAAVHLHGVTIDDFAAESTRQRKRQRALPATGRA
jgi:hypothetical protein